jgi:uncharacterized protein YjaZ
VSVIRTDQWLLELSDRPMDICEKIKVHFKDADASEIYDYLNLHGMYLPFQDENKLVITLQKNNVWEMVQEELQQLQQIWEGPDVPIYIFPSDPNNPILNKEFGGKSGLAFKNTLFLFISEKNKEKDIKSLLTHEYNHVCRLSKYPKNEDEYVLLDSIILEGLAEHAVLERYGEEYVSPWTFLYTNEQLEKMWKRLIYPNRNIHKTDYIHQDLLYGSHFYPKMSGYCVGYYLVKKHIEARNLTSKDLLNMESAYFA